MRGCLSLPCIFLMHLPAERSYHLSDQLKPLKAARLSLPNLTVATFLRLLRHFCSIPTIVSAPFHSHVPSKVYLYTTT